MGKEFLLRVGKPGVSRQVGITGRELGRVAYEQKVRRDGWLFNRKTTITAFATTGEKCLLYVYSDDGTEWEGWANVFQGTGNETSLTLMLRSMHQWCNADRETPMGELRRMLLIEALTEKK